MHPDIEKHWHKLEEAKKTYLEKLSEIPSELLHTQPVDSWSAIQVTEHLLFSETGTLGYMKKKSSGGWDALESTGQEQKANSDALNSRLISPEKYKAPSVLPEPANASSLDELTAQWDSVRHEMLTFVDGVSPEHYDKLVFRQPIAGMLNILQTLEFIGHHIHHHIPQLERIAKELKS
jgi:hypothetical protein